MYQARILRRPGFHAASSSWLSGRHPQYSSEIIKDKSDTGNTILARHEVPHVRPQGITSDEVNKSLTIDFKTALRFSSSGGSQLSSSFSLLQPSFITNESDGELDLLDQGHTTETIGEHELKTSPLVTRDAIARSGQFYQRGLLGSVLSVHATGLPQKTIDPRIYLNLDAPSSGLVCGVQGSGKSHTVSCILESSLIANRQIGSLPVPLSPVVFHFDEENGERPCEAAYLSELKGGTGIGVNEVVVLVSPSNLRTRRRVYSSLKFVRVEPLRIAEQDLNASRMLSMMGVDNLETLPLYMHTSLSILREMGSDNFNYRNFRKRLKDPKFNRSQSVMLELRLDLLDSLLQGNGPDVKSFFKPGRLVILDISDPFMESTTAAMLFDICLGLFIEWKSSKGKLIDEAHKYLMNADANRFTKSICSIIRQQRHLAARVIVSTQEPTVVPASVLDLLSWIICHRFSSPGWVSHLKRHICAEEEKTDGHSEWGRRVMTLRTGEALLYSPASLFATEVGDSVTLSAGYAIIKTRPRLTADGGASLLATETHFEANLEYQTSLSSPESLEHMLSPVSHSSPRPIIQPSTPIPRIIDPVVSSSVNHSLQGRPDLGAAHKSPAAFSQSLNQSPTNQPPIQTPHKFQATQPPSAKPILPPDAPSTSIGVTNSTNAGSLYSVLIQVLRSCHQAGVSQPEKSWVGSKLAKRKPSVYTGKLARYLENAVAAGVITLTGTNNQQMVTLVKAYLGPDDFPAPSPQGSSSPSKSRSSPDAVPLVITALLSIIAKLSGSPKGSVNMSVLPPHLKQHKDGDFKKAGYPRLKGLIDAATERGLVSLTRADGADIVTIL